MNNINTIFYYAESLSFSDYITMLQSGEITYRTIVFAQAQKAIYKGGVLYGATDLADLKEQLKTLLDGQEVIQKIENIVNNHFDLDPQDLPTASTTKKGCIKVGSGLVMGNDEKLNVDFSNLPSGQNGIDGLDGLVEQIIKTDASARASKNNYGVVRVGDGIDVTNGIISVSLTKGDKGDKGDTGAKGDKGDTGDRGPAGPSYDDSAIRSMIADNIANLQALINSFDSRVQAQVEEMLDDVQWMQEHWPSGSGSTSNFGQSDVESYLQMIGVWEENEAHTKLNAKWSKISQSIDNITARVQALEVNSGSGGTSSGSALTAEQLLQIAKIDDLETAIGSLQTSYADFEIDENNELKVLRWLSSALDLYSNANATWADLASAALNKSLSESGIAALQTRVTAVENGLISDARLTTLVQNKVNDVIGTSGFVSTSALSDALQPYATSASMFAAVGDVQSDVDSAIASINVCARYETEVVNGERVPKNYGTSGNPKYRMESAASIYADQIDISAAHKLTISAADQIDISSSALNAILGNFTVQAENVDFSAYNISLDAQNGEMWLGGGAGNYRAIVSPTEISVGTEGLNLSWVDYVKLDATSGSIIAKSNQGNGPWSEMGSWGFAHHSSASPGTVFSVDDSGNLECTQLHAWGDAVIGGNLSSNSNISATDDITAGGDITADGDMTADNLYIRNNGSVTVRTGGSISTPSITIGSSNDNSTLSYSSVDSIIDVNTGMCLDGELQANNIWLANNGGITIGSDTGFTGTLALGGGTLTFKGGILVDTTLSTV